MLSNLRLLLLPWSQLNRVIAGLIGKSMVIISLAVPVSKLINIGVDLPSYSFAAIGSVFITASYVLERTFVPEIIEHHRTSIAYASHLLSLLKNSALDYTGEFQLFNSFLLSPPPPEVRQDIEALRDFLPIKQGWQVLGEPSATYKFAIAKFTLTNKNRPALRALIAFLLISGLFLFYVPIGKALFQIVFIGAN